MRTRRASNPLNYLADETQGLEVTFPKPLSPAHQRLMDVLGVRVTIAPEPLRRPLPRRKAKAAP